MEATSNKEKLVGMEMEMEMEMEVVKPDKGKKKVEERIHLAIQQLILEKRSDQRKTTGDGDGDDEDEDHLLLSRLLSQVELLKEDNSPKLLDEPLAEIKESPSSGDVKVEKKDENKEMGTEEIVKELRMVKRQNTITHWLLSVMIFLTVTWQLSEVSLILTLKNRLSNPFKSVGNLIRWAIINGSSGAKSGEGNNNVTDASAKFSLSNCCPQLETPLPALKIPDLPYMDLPVLGLHNGGDHKD